MIKLCALTLDYEALEISKGGKDSSIDIALLLKVFTQLLPLDEIEFLDEINKMFTTNFTTLSKFTKKPKRLSSAFVFLFASEKLKRSECF